ncbi:MAG: hypothetical protein ACRDT0_22025 [Pseudonocardiaceae bacterium]
MTDPITPTNTLRQVAGLLRARNAIDDVIAAIIERPVHPGHLGEWIAAQIFDLELEQSVTTRAIDGRFRTGPLAGKTVDVKWYGKQEGMLDMTEHASPDYYLVLTGPRSAAVTSRGTTRPLTIESVYLFQAAKLAETIRAAGLKLGVATSVRRALWDTAEVYPEPTNPDLPVTDEQRHALSLFSTAT